MLLIVGEAIVAYQRDIGANGADHAQGFSGPWPSGSPAIAAYVAARLGVPTSFIGGTGRDDHGRVMYNGLAGGGVRLDYLRVIEDTPTATAYITYRGEASREFEFHVADTAATRVAPQDLATCQRRHDEAAAAAGTARGVDEGWAFFGGVGSGTRIRVGSGQREHGAGEGDGRLPDT
jgi:sugar/nucleoside kinase (ribokinase family)